MAQYDPVLLSVDKHVALITVNDPDRRNAVTDEMSAQLRAAIQRAEGDPDVHAVVVTGAGKAFCAGADLSALGAGVGDPAEPRLLRLYDGFMAVSSCNLPTIAAVNGAAVGAGLNLALAADVRIRTGRIVRRPLPKAGTASRWRRNLDAAASGGSAGRPCGLIVRHVLRRRIRCAARLGANGCRRSRHRGAGAGRRARSRPARGRAGEQSHHARHSQPRIAGP